MRKLTIGLIALALMLTGCNEADVASRNLSTAADQFEITRRVVFYNGITDTYMLEVIGLCSLGNFDGGTQRTVTCKIGDEQYVKHFVGLSDNVTFFVEQLEGVPVSVDNYRVVFRPQTIVPAIDLDLPGQK